MGDAESAGTYPRGASACPAASSPVIEVAGLRLAWVDLGRESGGEARLRELQQSIEGDVELRAVASQGGPGLALAALAALRRCSDQHPDAPVFAVSAGRAVSRGLPTAARVSWTAPRSSGSGLIEVQMGGEWAAGFAPCLDALIVSGEARCPVWLQVSGDGVDALPWEGGPAGSASTRERARYVRSLGGPGPVAVAGAGAEAGLPFATVCSFDGDGAPPSTTGRGGLGLALGRARVRGLFVPAPPADPTAGAGGSADLLEVLTASPRLLGRSVGGTLELGEGGVASRSTLPQGAATKHGCRGCPTPCGWSFAVESQRGEPDVPKGASVPRHSALRGFGEDVDALAALRRCDELGIDAFTAGRWLASTGKGGASVDDALLDLVTPGRPAHAEGLGLAADLVGHRADDDGGPLDRASRLGRALAVRGPERMRSLSVLGLGGDWTEDTERTRVRTGDPEGDAGALAYWHECFAAAVDVSGFCAFSAAALIADGVIGLDALGAQLGFAHGPQGGSSAGLGLLRAGALHLGLHRELRAGGAVPAPDDPGLAAAYRGYLHAVESGFPIDGSAADGCPDESAARSGATAPGGGRVLVRATGVLAQRLGLTGTGADLPLFVPADRATVKGLLGTLAEAHPRAAGWLFGPGGGALPAVLRGGTILKADDPVTEGDRLELLLVVPGG